MKAQNPFMKWLLHSSLHGVVSRMYLLITFIGRKTGTIYTTPVQYAQKGDTLYIITSEDYMWWKTLYGGAEVHLHLRGKTYRAYAEIAAEPQTIEALLAEVYPSLSAERRQRFAPGKVVILVTLQNKEITK